MSCLPSNQTKIISARKKKKYYDLEGSKIHAEDKDTIDLVKRGITVIKYHEDKVDAIKPSFLSKIRARIW